MIFAAGYLFVFLLSAGVLTGRSQENVWEFLPSSPLFRPLLADPREPRISFERWTSHGRWEVSAGEVLDIVQSPTDRKAPLYGRPFYSESRHWAWGVLGCGFARLEQASRSFLLRDNDWMYGTYFSTRRAIQSKSDPGRYKIVAARLEYTHQSSHLGDSFYGERPPLVYSREYIRGLFSFEATEKARWYVGMGALVHSIPREPGFFAQGGVELFGPNLMALSLPLRPFLAYDLHYKREAGRGVNQNLMVGFQWRRSATRDSRDIRVHFSYDRGRSDWGQYYRDWEEHGSFGLSLGL